MSRDRSSLWASLVIGTLLMGAAAGCGSSSEASGTKSSAKIELLEVPESASCGGSTSVTVAVRYATSGAARQRLLVDGRDEGLATGPDGNVSVPVHCDPLPHTVVLIAWDDEGRRTFLQKILQTT